MRFAVWASSAGNEGRSLVVAPDVIDGNGGVVLQIEPAAGGAAGGVGSAPDGQSRDADAKQHTAWFDRTSETSEADLIGRGFSRIGAGATFHGVCGLVKLRNEIWLGLVKEAAPVCTVQNRLVYKITQVCFVSLASDYYDGAVLGSLPAETLDQGANKEQDARHPCQDIIRYLSSGSFYFSTTLDLTRCMQMQYKDGSEPEGRVELDKCFDEFLFNRHMLKDLSYIRTSLEPEEKAELDDSGLLLAVIQGFVGVQTVRLQNREGSVCHLVLVSRLSSKRTGTRFLTRGIDDEGYVANFVETELIMDSPQYVLSFVQLRGSVPVFWEQPGVQGFNQKIELSRGGEATAPAFQKHFERLVTRYGKIEILNLLSSKEPESILTDAYTQHLKSSIPEVRDMVDMRNFDFHAECRTGNFENISYLHSGIAKWLDSAGYFLYQKQSRHPLLLQSGHVRVNCLDCLDRTNVVQTYLALRTIVRHCVEFMDADRQVFGLEADAAWRHLWSDNGDELSKIYAGSGAIRSSATRRGKQTLAGLLDDATKSVQRFVVNNFTDKSRQEVIDLLLGIGVAERTFLLRDTMRETVAERMRTREREYTSTKTFHVQMGTWNVNGKLHGEDLVPWLDNDAGIRPEFVVVAFQEIVELTPQQIVVTDVSRRLDWEDDVRKALSRMTKSSYVLLRSIQLVGASISVFALEEVVCHVRHVQASSIKTGLAGLAGNKGAAAVRLDFYDTPVCFITAHFAAGQSSVTERNRDYRTITEGIRFRGKTLDDHDVVLFAGDFNYRLDLDYETAIAYLAGDPHDQTTIQELLGFDQLRREMAFGRTFDGYEEGTITFPPTYKVVNGTTNVYENEKGRIPSWCDRILFRSRRPLKLLDYTAVPSIVTSDHKPVKALISVEALVIDHAKAARIRREISTEVARSRLRTTQAPPTRPVEPLIDISDANPFEPVSTTLRTFSDSNPFVSQRKHESGQAWWNDGGPIRRQNEIITTGKNPFRDEKIAALSRPNDWVAFD